MGIHVLIAFALGLLVRPFLVNLNAMVSRDLSRSGLFLAEATHLPSSRYRLSQIVAVLADHDGYSRSVTRRARNFERRYPKMRRGALILGIVIPAILAVLSVASVAEVPLLLGLWIVWILVIITFLIALEYIRESLARQQLLTSMDDSDVRSLLRRRLHGVKASAAQLGKHRLGNEENTEEGSEK